MSMSVFNGVLKEDSTESESDEFGGYGDYSTVNVGGGMERIEVETGTKIWTYWKGEMWYQYAGRGQPNLWYRRKKASKSDANS